MPSLRSRRSQPIAMRKLSGSRPARIFISCRAKGEFVPLASPEEAAAYPYAPVDRERIVRHRERLIVGGPEKVKERLHALAEATRADELMITTMVYDHGARRRSYEILAEAFAIAPAV